MPERIIEPFEFYGKTIYIEVTEVKLYQTATLPVASGQGLPPYVGFTSTQDNVVAAGETVRDIIAALAETVQQGLTHVKPDEWQLEVNIGFKGQTRIPFLAEGEANGAVKVTATWKSKPGDS